MGTREVTHLKKRIHKLEKALERFQALVEEQKNDFQALIEEQRREIEKLREENRILRAALNQRWFAIEEESGRRTSRPKVKPNVPKGERKRGPPKGHKGVSRSLPDHVDEEVIIVLEKCPNCESILNISEEYVPHTVEDIVIERRTVVRRYKQIRYWCPGCKKKVLAKAQGVLKKGRFGPQATMLMTTMRLEGLPVSTIQRHLERWWGLKISEATILDVVNRVANELRPMYDTIQERIRQSEYVNIDETGWRILGTNNWLWVFDAPEAVLFRIDRSRGGKVLKEVLGEDYQGVSGCDGYSAYNTLGCPKQQCLVHINRELQTVEAKRGIAPRPLLVKKEPIFIQSGRPPAEFLKFADSLRKILREAVEKWGKGPPYPANGKQEAEKYKRRIKRLVNRTYRDEDCQRITNSLNKRIDEMFSFVKYPGIPWHNNAAERALRPSVVTRKVSYGNQSDKGAETHYILRSVHDTWAKQNIDFIDQIGNLIGGTPMP